MIQLRDYQQECIDAVQHDWRRVGRTLAVMATGTPRCAVCKAALPWVVDAGDADFAGAADAKVPVLVDLWAPWCGPCRTMARGLEKVAATLAGKLKVVKVNVDEAPTIASRFDARSIPMLVLLENGRTVGSQVGAVPADRLESWIRATVTV